MTKTAEVVIIGGGISGCSIAYNLAKKGVRDVVLIERNYLASGSTGRCGAGIRTQWGTEMNCQLAKYSVEFYESAVEELEYEGDIEFKQGGYLLVATTPREEDQFRRNVALQRRMGIPSRLLTPAEAKQTVPCLDERRFTLAAFCQKDGHLNPFHTTQAFANAARRLGATILLGTRVTGIRTRDGRIEGVETDRGFIATRVVVNAAGGYSAEIGRMADVDVPVVPERHHILVTEPVEPMLDPMVMSFSLNIYCQQTPHGSFIMGRGDDSEPHDGRITSSWSFLEEMARTCCRLLPPLGRLSVLRQWAGLYENSPDRQPIYGPADALEGFYLACGFSGHGFMFAPATGRIVCEQILGEKSRWDVEKLSPDRFARGELMFEPSVV
jgi:sarcosine oxidase subunit beta